MTLKEQRLSELQKQVSSDLEAALRLLERLIAKSKFEKSLK